MGRLLMRCLSQLLMCNPSAEGNRSMSRAWDLAFEEAADELSGVRRDLGRLDSLSLTVKGGGKDSLLRARAATYVWLAAVLERFVDGWLSGVVEEFNSSSLRWSDVRLSILSLACGAQFQSIADGVRKDIWKKRVQIACMSASDAPALLDVAHLPLDGRTIRPSHLDDVWASFGFPGNPLPTPIHRALLNSVATYRNEVAHGVERPSVMGGKFTYSDYNNHVNRFEDIIEHLVICSEEYFERRLYAR